jgi:hypothetical protein
LFQVDGFGSCAWSAFGREWVWGDYLGGWEHWGTLVGWGNGWQLDIAYFQHAPFHLIVVCFNNAAFMVVLQQCIRW